MLFSADSVWVENVWSTVSIAFGWGLSVCCESKRLIVCAVPLWIRAHGFALSSQVILTQSRLPQRSTLSSRRISGRGASPSLSPSSTKLIPSAPGLTLTLLCNRTPAILTGTLKGRGRDPPTPTFSCTSLHAAELNRFVRMVFYCTQTRVQSTLLNSHSVFLVQYL